VSITFDDISPNFLTTLELKRIIRFLNEVNVACTFFVVPYEDKGISFTTENFTLHLKEALDYGHELALHGYKHTKNEFGCFYPIPLPVSFPTFTEQKYRLEEGLTKLMNLLGSRPVGFRAPFYLYNSVTLRALSKLGFSYDSSATLFKPAHNLRFRIKWLRVCRPFSRCGVIEIPVSGDYTYSLNGNNFYEFLKMALRDFERVKSHNGVFVLNNHPKRFRNFGERFLRILVKSLSKKAEFLRLCDVAEIYKT
jgi:peptidoglycan/xylan/chitin deacetylase (PgdA/CDA1 family)